MQKSKLSLLIVSGILMVGSSISANAMTTNSFTLTGHIDSTPVTSCDVDFGDGGNITMPKVDVSTFSSDLGAVSETSMFDVKIKGCPDSISTATAHIEGSGAMNNPSLLGVPITNGSAIGFGIEFLDGNKEWPINHDAHAIKLENGQGSMSVGVRYKTVLPHAALIGGDISAPGALVMVYK